MKLKISTSVTQPMEKVFEGFTQELFLKLSPPFPIVNLKRFDGSQPNDIVIIELNFILFKQVWQSIITETVKTEEEIYFIDKGVKLPFFLKEWQHLHRIVKNGDETLIVDDIYYKALGGWIGSLFFFPALWLQFLYRKPVYKKFFADSNKN